MDHRAHQDQDAEFVPFSARITLSRASARPSVPTAAESEPPRTVRLPAVLIKTPINDAAKFSALYSFKPTTPRVALAIPNILPPHRMGVSPHQQSTKPRAAAKPAAVSHLPDVPFDVRCSRSGVFSVWERLPPFDGTNAPRRRRRFFRSHADQPEETCILVDEPTVVAPVSQEIEPVEPPEEHEPRAGTASGRTSKSSTGRVSRTGPRSGTSSKADNIRVAGEVESGSEMDSPVKAEQRPVAKHDVHHLELRETDDLHVGIQLSRPTA